MRIEMLTALTPEQKVEIQTLEQSAYADESLENNAFLSGELNVVKTMPCFFLGYEGDSLVSFLTVFAPTMEDGEVIAFTHPDYRRQGRFRALYRAACDAMDEAGIGRTVFAVEPKGKSGLAVLGRFPDRVLLRSEYRMEWRAGTAVPPQIPPPREGFSVVPLSQETKAEFIRLSPKGSGDEAAHFAEDILASAERKGHLLLDEKGKAVGIFSLQIGEKQLFLFGVAVDSALQNRGCGREMVRCAQREAVRLSLPVVLDVDSENPPALHLYQSCGFQSTFQVDYYACSAGLH